MSTPLTEGESAARHSHLARPTVAAAVFVVKARTLRRVDGTNLDLGHALAPASWFRNAASPASEISTHFGWCVASAA